MTIAVHRHTDVRVCGHTTVVQGQDNVYANNLLIAVDNDPNNAGGGELDASNTKNVYINNKLIVNNTVDNAAPDSSCPESPHCNPHTNQGSPDVFVADK